MYWQEFAKQFGMSLQPVYEARTRRLVIEIGLMNQQDIERTHARFDELLTLAGQITDTVFLLSLRSIDIADRGIKRKFLEFLVANVKAGVRNRIPRPCNLIESFTCSLTAPSWRKSTNNYVDWPRLILSIRTTVTGTGAPLCSIAT